MKKVNIYYGAGFLVWVALGFFLLWRARERLEIFMMPEDIAWYWLPIILVLALLKSETVLKKAVKRHKIYLSKEPPVLKFFPLPSIIIILIMIPLGIFIRYTGLGPEYTAGILAWVGCALLLASRHYLILKI